MERKWPQVGLVITRAEKGILIQQDKTEYVARSFQLSPEIEKLIDVAIKFGFKSMLQHNHPREANRGKSGPGVTYLAFSRNYHDIWTFGINMDCLKMKKSCDGLYRVMINKKYSDVLKSNHISYEVEWGSSQNVYVDINLFERSVGILSENIS